MPASARLRRLVVTLTLTCLAAFATAAPAMAQVPPVDCLPFEGNPICGGDPLPVDPDINCLPFEGNPICGGGPDLGWIWELIGT